MIVLAIIIGIALPALVGWLVLDLLEWDTPVLWRAEKWVWGFALGMTLSMFMVFLGNVYLGIPLTLAGFLGIFGAMVILLGGVWMMRRGRRMNMGSMGVAVQRPYVPTGMHSLPRWMTIGLIVLGAWVGLRIIAMAVDVALTPTFFDDAMDNWNLRGKFFFFQKTIALTFPWDTQVGGISSYPPTVPLAKAWLSTLAGTWNEGLSNSIHGIWFVCLLLLVYWTLRRMLSWKWSALGAIVLASLPLEMIHGMNPYADAFLSLHLFMAVALVFHAINSRTHDAHTHTWFRLAAFAIALVPFTKNEGWALYFPVLILLYGGSVLWLRYRKTITTQQMITTALFAIILASLITIPWISYKVMNGLPFGNAKGIDLNFQWQPGVTLSIIVNTFLEGNWGLLFPLFFGLLITRWRAAFRSPLLLLSAFVLIPSFGQLFLYMFTGLSTEALLQTGYARGLIHLMPVIVILTILLLHHVVSSYELRVARTRNSQLPSARLGSG